MARSKQTKRKPRDQQGGRGRWKGAKRRREEADREKEGKQGEGYPALVRENPLLEKYYKGQGLIPDDEWGQFLATMRENLPATFRITGTKTLAESVLACLEHKYFRELHSLEIEGEKIPPPQPLSWYPDRLAWHVPLSRRFIRKSPLLSKFHSFLVKESEQGNISRQEAVSMVPPLLLGVEPHHKVLDMCAAPGSKTTQLIEFLHGQDSPSHPIPDGMVIANDADNKRCYMLVHQAKRLNSPCLMVTNHDASVFPVLYYHNESGVRLPLHYDRVLCDVPCSGDGTLRKNPLIWHTWNPSLGPTLHRLQLRIITRGLELLSPGGQLVYSTCSLNPVEDEAVIATMLSLSKGAIELVDCSDKLQELKRNPGLTTWRVMLKNGEWVESLEKTPPSRRNQLQESMFPRSRCEVEQMHLDRCIRILPHHQDTGGFFVAVLQKHKWLPWQRQANESASTNKAKEGPTDVSDDQVGGDGVTPPTELLEGLGPSTCAQLDPSLNIVACGDKPSIGGSGNGDDDTDARLGISNEEELPEVCCDDLTKDEDQQEATESMEVEDRPSVHVLGRPGYSKQQKSGYREDPFVFFDRDSEICQQISDHFGFPASFPTDQLLSRTHIGKKRNLYLTSRLIKELTVRNEKDVKIIAIGVRVLSRCDHLKTTCDFRLTQEGIDGMVPFVSKRVVALTVSDAIRVLAEANPLTSSLSPSTQQILASTEIGPALFVFNPGMSCKDECLQSVPLKCPIHLSGWVAAKSVRLFVAHQERYHFLAMLGVDPPEKQNLETISGHRLQQKEEDEWIDEEGDEEKIGDQLSQGETMLAQERNQLDQHGSEQPTVGHAGQQEEDSCTKN